MDVVLYLLAAICFLVAAAIYVSRRSPEVALTSLGLFLWVLVPLLRAAGVDVS